MSHNNWVLGIEDEIKNAYYYKLLWAFIFLSSGFVVFFLNKRPHILGEIPEIILNISLLIFLFSLVKLTISPKNPEYLAYYLYKVGDNFSDFETESRYLKKNKQYIKKCNRQITYLNYEKIQKSDYFISNIIEFLNDLEDLTMRLNHLYNIENEDKMIISRLMGMSSDDYITEKEFISKYIIELSNLIYREHSFLVPEHVIIARKLLDELDYIPKRQFEKSFSRYFKEIWNKLDYKFKYLFFGATILTAIFFIVSLILVLLEQEQPYSAAMFVSASLTAVVLSQIDRFITH